jgi:hypothetical protein
MKAKLTLNNPLWQTPQRRAMLDKAVQQGGAELEAEIKQTIRESQPAGRTYRRRAITKATSRNLPAGLRKRNNRFIVGSEFHRASRRGQPPAIDTAGLINSIRGRKTGPMKTTVSVGKRYGAILDDPNGLNRPFFRSTVKAYLPRFKDKIRKVISGG